ncbi:hypothetical protein TRVL_04824 [Trypanosoma vivax]|nr:hypothetical protein TRVL_04824 [Trypanosoma vivax]
MVAAPMSFFGDFSHTLVDLKHFFRRCVRRPWCHSYPWWSPRPFLSYQWEALIVKMPRRLVAPHFFFRSVVSGLHSDAMPISGKVAMLQTSGATSTRWQMPQQRTVLRFFHCFIDTGQPDEDLVKQLCLNDRRLHWSPSCWCGEEGNCHNFCGIATPRSSEQPAAPCAMFIFYL